jgi:hypothetical protein
MRGEARMAQAWPARPEQTDEIMPTVGGHPVRAEHLGGTPDATERRL